MPQKAYKRRPPRKNRLRAVTKSHGPFARGGQAVNLDTPMPRMLPVHSGPVYSALNSLGVSLGTAHMIVNFYDPDRQMWKRVDWTLEPTRAPGFRVVSP